MPNDCVFAKGSAYSVFVWITRNRRRRAKALLDFERHDDDELGFRKNDIVTVSCLSTVCKAEHYWNVQTIPTIMLKTLTLTQCSSSLSLIEWWLSVLLNSTRMWRIVLAHFAINCADFKELLQDPLFKAGLSGGKPVENRKFKLQVSSESKSNAGHSILRRVFARLRQPCYLVSKLSKLEDIRRKSRHLVIMYFSCSDNFTEGWTLLGWGTKRIKR